MSTETLLHIPTIQDLKEFAGIQPQESNDDLSWYFPQIEPGRRPFGARVLVQLRRTRKTTASGIVLAQETKEAEKWNDQVAKVVAIGPIAFCNRETGQPWPEGTWAKPGMFVSVPRWGGDRWTKKVNDDKDADEIRFAIFNDHEMISEITEDPKNVKAFILE